MADVSAVIATLNEEDQIRGCLETLSWCDEIIIIDNDSSDSTVEIAEEYTDQIYQYEERHGYGDPLKEYGVQKASNKWIFVIDADERVQVALAQRLKEIALDGSTDVVKIPFKNYSLGIWVKGGGWWPAHHPRFFRKEAVDVTKEIHGYLSVEEDVNVLKLSDVDKYRIIHFNHSDVENKLSSVNSYTTVEARETDFSFWQMTFAPVVEFLNRYILKRGYRLGLHGLILAIFQAWYEWIIAVKCWENKKVGGKKGIKSEYSKIEQDVVNEWKND